MAAKKTERPRCSFLLDSNTRCAESTIHETGLCAGHLRTAEPTLVSALCMVCDTILDERGRCIDCLRMKEYDLKRLKIQTIHLTMCAIHGTHEVVGRPVHVGGKRGVGGRWVWNCAKCGLYGEIPEQIKMEIEKREEEWKPDLAERQAKWDASGSTGAL